MELVIWAMVAYGMTNILVYGSIFNELRNSIHNWGNNESLPFNFFGSFLSGLISCVLCTSTWVGFFLSFAYYSPNEKFMEFNSIVSFFFDGMLSAGLVWMINSIVEWFEENRPVRYIEPTEKTEEVLNEEN